MGNPHRTRLLANINKAFTDQGFNPPDISMFQGKNGKPLPARQLRRISRGMGLSISEKQARTAMKPEPPEEKDDESPALPPY